MKILNDVSINRNQEIKELARVMNLSKTISESQTNFLNSTLGGALNFAVNMGIRSVLPDLIEDKAIEIKDTILDRGVIDGTKVLVDQVKDFGKNMMGLFNGNFNNPKELEKATKNIELYKLFSQIVYTGIDTAVKGGHLDKNTGKLLKDTNKVMIKNFSESVNKSVTKENEKFKKLEKYNNDWEEAWLDRDIEKMDKALKNINKTMENLTLYQEPIIKADRIKELHRKILETKNFDYQEGM